jgi:hypothetical protein
MHKITRFLLVLLGAAALASCSDMPDFNPSGPTRQEAHTNPLGQTYYTYKKEDGQ